LEGDKPGGLGTEVPQWVKGQSLGGSLGAKPPKAEDIYANNHYNNALTKTPQKIFSAWKFPGGHVPLVSPFPTPLFNTSISF